MCETEIPMNVAEEQTAPLPRPEPPLICFDWRMIMEVGRMRHPRLFTPSEAAALTQVPLKTINNAIDKGIVPTFPAESGESARRLRLSGLLALVLERQLASCLVPEERRKLFAAI